MVAAVATAGWSVSLRLAWCAVPTAYWFAQTLRPGVYADEELISFHPHKFLDDPAFQPADRLDVPPSANLIRRSMTVFRVSQRCATTRTPTHREAT